MIKRVAERYCLKQREVIKALEKENRDECLADSRYEASLSHHRRAAHHDSHEKV
jgi:hypothetical protein